MSTQGDVLSIVSLIENASLLVKLVMLLLFLGSVVSWIIIIQRAIYQRHAKFLLNTFENQFWSGVDLTQLYRQGNDLASKGKIEGVETIFRAGYKEFFRLRQQKTIAADTVMDGVQRAMYIALGREQVKLEANLPFLASIASVSPYIGLFGTVWGIMNSFRKLATTTQATLAIIAPSISEALVATAMGLFAAIPAVLAYNRFSAESSALINSYEIFSEEFSCILYRQLHR